MPVYRPAVIMKLKLRFDEAISGEKLPDIDTVELLLQQPLDDDPKKAKNALPGLLQPGDPRFVFIPIRIPKTLSWEKPGYRQAGHFKATFDYRDFPIDPTFVRAAAVEIHAGTVSDSDFAKGLSGRSGVGYLKSILNPVTGSNVPNQDTFRLGCLVDEWYFEHGDKSSEVIMEGRDLRGVLIDTPINAGIPDNQQGTTPTLIDELDLTKPIDEVVGQILRYDMFFTEIKVIANAEDWDKGIVPAPGAQDSRPRHRKGARGKKSVATQNSSATDGGLSFWDLIVKVCYLVGGIPFFRGWDLHIRPSMTVYDKLRGPIDPVTNPTPFKGGNQRVFDPVANASIPPISIRTLHYGRDILKLRNGRKYQGWRKPKVVQAVGHDIDAATGAERTIVGVWPQEDSLVKTKATSVSPGKAIAGQEILAIPVAGITSIAQLIHIAHGVYEEIGRGEINGDIETTNLSSFGGDNSDPDLLWLEPGDGIQIFFDMATNSKVPPSDLSVQDYYRNPVERLVAQIYPTLGDMKLARAIALTTLCNTGVIQRFFRVQTVKFNWSHTGDIKINLDFQNYLVVRAEESTASSTPGTAGSITTPAKPKKGTGLGSTMKAKH